MGTALPKVSAKSSILKYSHVLWLSKHLYWPDYSILCAQSPSFCGDSAFKSQYLTQKRKTYCMIHHINITGKTTPWCWALGSEQ